MSEVEVRQIPLKSAINDKNYAGSWFSTGYYGHFRAKSRIDLCNSFRHLARPDPPKKFVDRQCSAASSHVFSQHDNRFKFESDPLVRASEKGFGRRKHEKYGRGPYNPFLISWHIKKDGENDFDETVLSTYENDYNRNSKSAKISYEIESMKFSSPSIGPLSNGTAYGSVYNHGQPTFEQAKRIRQETLQRYSNAQKRLAEIQNRERSTNVASCLVWNNRNPENKPVKTTETIIDTVVPITTTTVSVQPTVSNSRETASFNNKIPYQSQSMPAFKTSERSFTSTTTSREHYSAQILPPLSASKSTTSTCKNDVENLVSKYM